DAGGVLPGIAALRAAVSAVRPDAAVLRLAMAEGLEFDMVVLVGPESVLDRSPQGLQDLYVGATRATQDLVLVQPGGFGPLLTEVRDTASTADRELTA